MRRISGLLCLLWVSLAAADVGWRCELHSTSDWEARPDWINPHAQRPRLTASATGLRLGIDEPGQAMKWRRALDDLDFELAPWLVVRYRAEGYDPQVDYVLWAADGSTNRDGVKLLLGPDLTVDGQWHTRAVHLPTAGLQPPLQQLALQCRAAATGAGWLELGELYLTDLPPTDAAGFVPPAPVGQRWPVRVGAATAWTHQPGWLSQPHPASAATATAAGLRFTVPAAGHGGKWSRQLDPAVEGAGWVALRYRAQGQGGGGDYALYLAGSPGGQAAQEQYVVQLGQLVSDGDWHVAVQPVKVPRITTLAVQVQAMAPAAWLEVAGITFSEGRPEVPLADLVDQQPGRLTAPWRAVALPPGNLTGADLARQLQVAGWLAPGERLVDGIPFGLRPDPTACATPLTEPGTISLELTGRAAEAYLWLAARLPGSPEPGVQGPAGVVRQVERLVASLEYTSGPADEQLPWAVRAASPQVSAGLHVYALALDPQRELRRLTLRDGYARGSFALLAATLSPQAGPASAAYQPVPNPPQPAARPVAARRIGLTVLPTRVVAATGSLDAVIDLTRGVRLASLVSQAGVNDPLQVAPGPLFEVVATGQTINSEQCQVVSAAATAGGARLVTRATLPGGTAQITLDLAVAGDELALQASLELQGLDPRQTQLHCPVLRGARVGPGEGDTWYWYPRQGDLVSNLPTDQRGLYSGRVPLQGFGIAGARGEGGLYLRTEDQGAVPRFHRLRKSDGACDLAIEYSPAWPGQLPRTVIGCHQGPWQVGFARYRDWLASWYQPAAPRQAWFREVFNFRQQFLTFALPRRSGLFDPTTRRFHFAEVLAADRAAFGGLDYLHLFDWGWDPVNGRCGDYTPWDYLGPPAQLHREVDQLQQGGLPVGLYLEGYLVDPTSRLGQAHGEAWQLLTAAGQPYTTFAPSFHICPWVTPWQDYLAATYARARRETGARGFYIDQYGFSNHYLCHNPAHGHPVPAVPVLGERQMLQKVRQAVGPDAALYTEESPTDVNSQFQDGSFTYHIAQTAEATNPSGVNLYRFALPSFKTIEIIVCDQPLGSNVEAVKRVLFNGEAIWLEGIADRWFAPETLAYIRTMHRILRANRDCFSSDFARPLVPTRYASVYANRFDQDATGGTACWTIFNTGFRTLEGEVLELPAVPGARYRELTREQPVTVRQAGERVFVPLRLAPREVLVLRRDVAG
ncbi:MAG: hypothetical protein IT204_15690 [Fimbriimonadaceae bacterium]|nr:hypothetical protein [Fimbriimonadaceae bacterium]